MAFAVVLAGGLGSRIGGDKALVLYDGRPLIEHALAAVRDAGLEAVVVAKADSALPALDCRIVREPDLPRHPLCGIVAGLQAVPDDGAVVLPIDMPGLRGELLAWLAGLPQRLAVVRSRGRVQPLVGRYATSLLDELRALLPSEPAMRAVVERLGARIVEEEEIARFGDPLRMLANINAIDGPPSAAG